MNYSLLFTYKSNVRGNLHGRTKMQFHGTYLKFCLNTSGECPVCFLKNRIK
jgi:hypothetical protein